MIDDPTFMGMKLRFEAGRPFLDIYRDMSKAEPSPNDPEGVLFDGIFCDSFDLKTAKHTFDRVDGGLVNA